MTDAASGRGGRPSLQPRRALPLPVADPLEDRILGALVLAGIGDALGAVTEHWTIGEIAAAHGGLVTRFIAPPPDSVPGVLGSATAEVTDDASQLYCLADALIAAGGRLDADGWLRCLVRWADTSPKAAFMGPSTAAVVEALRAGRDPARIGAIGDSARKVATFGITNGAAMRVAPCGLVHPGRVAAACEQAVVTCLPSHDTDVAIASACCIAGGVAQALVDGVRVDGVIAACVEGAERGERLGRERARAVPGPRLGARLRRALEIAAEARDDRGFLERLEAEVGNSMLAAESVPSAVAIYAYARADPLRTVALAASAGNDTDTIATMAGALAGATRGAAALPSELVEPFWAVNAEVYGIARLAVGLRRLAPTQPA